MKLELKNIKVNLTFSEETTMFQADLYANGKKIAYANNDGRGGCTFYNRYPNQEKALAEAEAYAKTLPSDFYEFGGKKHEIKMTLEHWIDTQIEAYVEAKESAKFQKKMEKDMLTHIVYGVPNSGKYRMYGFKGNKLPLTELVKMEKGREAVKNLIETVKKQLKEGEEIFNKNLPI